MDLVRQRAISKGAGQIVGTSHWALSFFPTVQGERVTTMKTLCHIKMAWVQGIWRVKKVLVYKLFLVSDS